MSERETAFHGDVARWVEALTWYEKLTEPREAELTSALIRKWRGWHADPENERTFDELTRLISDARLARRRWTRARQVHLRDDRYDPAISIALWQLSCIAHSRVSRLWWQPRRSRLVSVLLLAAAAAIAAAVWIPWHRLAPPAEVGRAPAHWAIETARYETAIGQLKRIHLGDGSEITLGGGTRVVVNLSARARSVELVHGEAWFRVVHKPQWPFVVDVGDGAITATGTAFLVTRDSDLVVVTVTEGTISVNTPSHVRSAPPVARKETSPDRRLPIRVTGGHEITYHDNGAVTPVVTADTHAATAWIQGRLIFDNQPLKYVIESVNRYSTRRLVVTPSAGSLRFSGVILIGGFEEWLLRLPDVFPVDIDYSSAGACIRLHGEQRDTRCGAAQPH